MLTILVVSQKDIVPVLWKLHFSGERWLTGESEMQLSWVIQLGAKSAGSGWVGSVRRLNKVVRMGLPETSEHQQVREGATWLQVRVRSGESYRQSPVCVRC